MKIVIVYDSETKAAQVALDGSDVSDLSGLSMYNRGEDGFDLNLSRQTADETGVVETQSWSCYASKDKVSNPVKDLFKKL